MAGRGGIEDDMVKFRGEGFVAEKLGEFVEGRNLHGACPRQLFFHAL
jgi:hypothetical protein